ncbi:MAG TPA: cell division protein ZapA [Stellaceae bacterium]|jgi:cell division protein ZapA
MALVTLKVNGRDFPVSCEDGQEPRLRRLAQYIDGKVQDFTKTMGQVGDARLILLAALVIADELSDANEAVQQSRGRAVPNAEENAAVATGIHGIAQRIESIAARLESS